MKNKIVNKFKSAGVWNIACGVLYALAYISVFVILDIEFLSGEVSSDFIEAFGNAGLALLFTVLVTTLGIYLWDIFIIFPFFMILTGAEMLSKHKKGAGVKALIVFNALFKLLAVFLNLVFGVQFLTLKGFVVLSGAVLIISAALMLVSIIMDFRALFKREKIA